jgi:hypothetical protein
MLEAGRALRQESRSIYFGGYFEFVGGSFKSADMDVPEASCE